ncbi:MAG: hypothetical protein NTU72_04740, partial [Fimbriimonadales bacterium]|nr:hypothetical protein [Fimbriimonadales bacterium]
MNWILIKAKQTPAPADWSPIINTFRDYGIENTLEEANCITGCYVDVDGVRTQIESLRTALLALGVDDVIDEPFVEVDWENEWKKFFKPRRVGSH